MTISILSNFCKIAVGVPTTVVASSFLYFLFRAHVSPVGMLKCSSLSVSFQKKIFPLPQQIFATFSPLERPLLWEKWIERLDDPHQFCDRWLAHYYQQVQIEEETILTLKTLILTNEPFFPNYLSAKVIEGKIDTYLEAFPKNHSDFNEQVLEHLFQSLSSTETIPVLMKLYTKFPRSTASMQLIMKIF